MPYGLSPSQTRWTKAELALAVVLPVTVFAFAMASSSVSFPVAVGRPLRWVMLFVLAGVAVVYGWPNRRSLPRSLVIATSALVGLGLLSAVWSVTPEITVKRAVSFAVLVVAAAFLGAGTLDSPRRSKLVLTSLLVGPVFVAIAGLAVLAFDHGLAVQAPGPGQPSRLRGFGENPNTNSMLFALVLPIAAWAIVTGRRIAWRVLATAIAVLLYGSVVASASRGAMLASAAGTIVFVVVRTERVRVLVPAVVVLVAFFGATFRIAGARPARSLSATQSQPAATVPAKAAGTTTPGQTGQGSTSSASHGLFSRFRVDLAPPGAVTAVPIPFVPEHDEIGYPGIYQYKPILGYGGGRVFAWISALGEGLHRPVLGYGFGTEQYVFVDRFYIFDGGFPENSFVGMFLELGIVGVLLLLTPFVIVALAAIRVVRGGRSGDRGVVAVGVGVMASGFVVAFFQSYIYSVGNVATLSVWVALFTTVTLALRGREAR